MFEECEGRTDGRRANKRDCLYYKLTYGSGEVIRGESIKIFFLQKNIL